MMLYDFRKIGMAAALASTLCLVPAKADGSKNQAPPTTQPDKAPPDKPSFAEQLAQRENRLKRMMTNLGVADEAVQNAIIAHLKTEIETRRPMREQTMRLQHALRDQSTPDAQIKLLAAEMRAAVEADRQRRIEADKHLDEQIAYSQKPRLEAMLLLLGVIGDGAMMLPLNPPLRHNDDEAGEKRRQLMLQRYDKNNDGKLDEAEKAARDEEEKAVGRTE